MQEIIAENIVHSYLFAGSKHHSLDDISLTVNKGELVAVLGKNGCGKTTLARHFNALIPVQNGELRVAQLDAKNKKSIWEIRNKCGMVFQNPSNQFVSSLLEEDIAFAPRNFGVPESEIKNRVTKSLELVGLSGFEKRSPQLLSGGQQQRAAIAGVLAANPDIMVLDEVTSMLDPQGRDEVLSVIKSLHNDGRTIVMISHYIEEAVFADTVVIMSDGKIIAKGTPREVLTDIELLYSANLTPPMPVRAYYDLAKRGIKLGMCPLTNEELVSELCRLN